MPRNVDTDLGAIIQSKEWPCTVAGWLWYCDVHDTHGNADTEDEAHDVAAAHELHHGDADGCDLYVTKIEPGSSRSSGTSPVPPTVPCPYCTGPITMPWNGDGEPARRGRCDRCGRKVRVRWQTDRVAVEVVP